MCSPCARLPVYQCWGILACACPCVCVVRTSSIPSPEPWPHLELQPLTQWAGPPPSRRAHPLPLLTTLLPSRNAPEPRAPRPLTFSILLPAMRSSQRQPRGCRGAAPPCAPTVQHRATAEREQRLVSAAQTPAPPRPAPQAPPPPAPPLSSPHAGGCTALTHAHACTHTLNDVHI